MKQYPYNAGMSGDDKSVDRIWRLLWSVIRAVEFVIGIISMMMLAILSVLKAILETIVLP